MHTIAAKHRGEGRNWNFIKKKTLLKRKIAKKLKISRLMVQYLLQRLIRQLETGVNVDRNSALNVKTAVGNKYLIIESRWYKMKTAQESTAELNSSR